MQIKINNKLIDIIDYVSSTNGCVFTYTLKVDKNKIDNINDFEEATEFEIINGETTIVVKNVSINHYSVYLDFVTIMYAKQGETIDIVEKINEIDSNITTQEEALCDVDSTYTERLAQVEEALCELSELVGGLING